MRRVLISGCLMGQCCRYDGQDCLEAASTGLLEFKQARRILSVCPECLGGLPTPRPKSEIVGGDGWSVLGGSARVVNEQGVDVTQAFISGAEKVLAMGLHNQVSSAVLKSKSPSCGIGVIYDGSFTGRLKRGDGVTTALLKKHSIRCISEADFR